MKSLSFSKRMFYYASRYVLIGLGIYTGSILFSYVLSSISNYFPLHPKDFIGLFLIPALILVASLIILFRFSREQDHLSDLINGSVLGMAGIKFVGYSLLVGILLILASRSFVMMFSWLFSVIKY